MSLDQAIEHNKEKRKKYYGWKAIDKTCRNHGSDKSALENRKHHIKKKELSIDEQIKELEK